jgi:hypothetical protein
MTRPNSSVIERYRKSGSVSIHLSNLIHDIIKTQSPFINIYRDIELDNKVETFFKEYYIKLDKAGGTIEDCMNNKIILSSYETEVYNLLMNMRHSSNLCISLGHSGTGKSTLLRYVLCYLWYICPIFNEKVFPVYINLSLYREEIEKEIRNREGFFRFLNIEIIDFVYNFILNFLRENFEECFKWIHNNPVYNRGGFGPRKMSEIEQMGLDNFITTLTDDKSERPNDLDKLIFDCLLYYAKNINTVVIVLDDVDRFTIDVHRMSLEFLDEKIARGFNAIASMRVSTYKKLERSTFEITDRIVKELIYGVGTVKKILKARIGKSKGRVNLLSDIPINVDTQQLIDAFSDLLINQDSLDILANLSNKSLDSLLRKIGLMLDSVYFNDELLGNELLRQTSSQPFRRRIWILYSLLFGNYYGSFLSDDLYAKCGIVNLFCSSVGKGYPYTHFLRLHILTYCLIAYKDDESFIKISDLYKAYSQIFGYAIDLTLTFNRAIFRLFQSGLLYSKKWKSYEHFDTTDENIIDDSICISPAGKFYMQNMIHRIDYFYFMKDDVDWIKDYKFNIAEPDMSGIQKFKETLKALKLLMEIEYDVIEVVANDNSAGYRQKHPRYKNLINEYRDLFSLYGNGANTVMFTRIMYASFLDHIKRSFGMDTSDIFDEELKNIDLLVETNHGIERQFLQ